MRVLIVDDSPLDIELVSRALQRQLNATVESVHTAEEGLRRLKIEVFDVVLLDYCLPGQNGLDFLYQIKQTDIATPIVLLTARGDQRIQEVARQYGAMDYISKDETLTPALVRAVEAASERGRAMRSEKELERAEERRHTAEILIEQLEGRIHLLESAVGTSGLEACHSQFDHLDAPAQEQALRQLNSHYMDILTLWVTSDSAAHKARERLGSFTAELFTLGMCGTQLLSIHACAVKQLRTAVEEKAAPPHAGCSPKMLLFEASISLLDAYRRAALSSRTRMG